MSQLTLTICHNISLPLKEVSSHEHIQCLAYEAAI